MNMRDEQIRPIHPFPARMAPSIVWEALPNGGYSLDVLDPMAGSGTTLVTTKAKGHKAHGCDTDPLAILIAKAWCSEIDPDRLRRRGQLILEKARSFSKTINPAEAYPSNIDDETRQFLNYWFDEPSRVQLSALSRSISRIRNLNERLLLWCAFSRLIITKKTGVSLAMDISHSRPHRVYQKAPVQPFDKYCAAVEYVAKHAPFKKDEGTTPAANMRYGDARKLPFEDNSFDWVITSPPYLNAIDYLRGHKFSLVWMGYSISHLRGIRSSNIGVERGYDNSQSNVIEKALCKMGKVNLLPQRNQAVLIRYLGDMILVIQEIQRVLRSKGYAVIVIGDSTVRGIYIRNSLALEYLGSQNGLELISKKCRPIPDSRRYLPPPSLVSSGDAMKNRMRKEVILTFRLIT